MVDEVLGVVARDAYNVATAVVNVGQVAVNVHPNHNDRDHKDSPGLPGMKKTQMPGRYDFYSTCWILRPPAPGCGLVAYAIRLGFALKLRVHTLGPENRCHQHGGGGLALLPLFVR